MGRKSKAAKFREGDLVTRNGNVEEVLIADQDEHGRTWCFVKPFVEGSDSWVDWFPEDAFRKVYVADIGFNGCDETQMYPESANDLRELLDTFFKENDIENPHLDYALAVEE